MRQRRGCIDLDLENSFKIGLERDYRELNNNDGVDCFYFFDRKKNSIHT